MSDVVSVVVDIAIVVLRYPSAMMFSTATTTRRRRRAKWRRDNVTPNPGGNKLSAAVVVTVDARESQRHQCGVIRRWGWDDDDDINNDEEECKMMEGQRDAQSRWQWTTRRGRRCHWCRVVIVVGGGRIRGDNGGD
jgi:hypothetical protein